MCEHSGVPIATDMAACHRKRRFLPKHGAFHSDLASCRAYIYALHLQLMQNEWNWAALSILRHPLYADRAHCGSHAIVLAFAQDRPGRPRKYGCRHKSAVGYTGNAQGQCWVHTLSAQHQANMYCCALASCWTCHSSTLLVQSSYVKHTNSPQGSLGVGMYLFLNLFPFHHTILRNCRSIPHFCAIRAR